MSGRQVAGEADRSCARAARRRDASAPPLSAVTISRWLDRPSSLFFSHARSMAQRWACSAASARAPAAATRARRAGRGARGRRDGREASVRRARSREFQSRRRGRGTHRACVSSPSLSLVSLAPEHKSRFDRNPATMSPPVEAALHRARRIRAHDAWAGTDVATTLRARDAPDPSPRFATTPSRRPTGRAALGLAGARAPRRRPCARARAARSSRSSPRARKRQAVRSAPRAQRAAQAGRPRRHCLPCAHATPAIARVCQPGRKRRKRRTSEILYARAAHAVQARRAAVLPGSLATQRPTRATASPRHEEGAVARSSRASSPAASVSAPTSFEDAAIASAGERLRRLRGVGWRADLHRRQAAPATDD